METYEMSQRQLIKMFNKLIALRKRCKNNGQRYKVDKVLKPCREELIRRERGA
jgi:hypothetical protein